MASNKRERELARQRYLRQTARRDADRRKAKQRQQVIAAVVAVVAVLGGVIGIGAYLANRTDDNAPIASPSANASIPSAEPSEIASADASDEPTAAPVATGCEFKADGQPSRQVSVPTLAANAKVPASTVTLKLNTGTITIAMDGPKAPCAATSFAHLTKAKFYDNTPCHRLTTGGLFVLQCGDPTGTGTGGPGYAYKEENLPVHETVTYPAGTVAMAKTAAPNSTGSQIFLVYKDTTLDPAYTVLGKVTAGLDVLQKIADKGVEGGGADGKPAQAVTIVTATTTDTVTK